MKISPTHTPVPVLVDLSALTVIDPDIARLEVLDALVSQEAGR